MSYFSVYVSIFSIEFLGNKIKIEFNKISKDPFNTNSILICHLIIINIYIYTYIYTLCLYFIYYYTLIQATSAGNPVGSKSLLLNHESYSHEPVLNTCHLVHLLVYLSFLFVYEKSYDQSCTSCVLF